METVEKWARIDFNNAWYEVSTTGKVRSISADPRYLIPKVNALGAPTVRIRYKDADGKKAMAFLSLPKLVASTFPELVPNPNKLPLIGYRDGNELNCAVSNLYWKDYARGYGTSTAYKEAAQRKAQKHAEKVAGQQQWWSAMTYAEQQEMLKLGQPMEGVKLKEKDDDTSNE
jgi:hypothetical protein